MDSKNNQESQILIRKLFPDASTAFFFRVKTINELKDSCIFVLDTNVLLVPYAIGKDSIQVIRKTLTKLVAEERVIIPGQVVREFLKNKPGKIAEIHQQLQRTLSSLKGYQKGAYPLLEGLSSYQEVKNQEENLDEILKIYREKLNTLIQEIRSWDNNDPVFSMYREVFNPKCIFEPEIDEEKINLDLRFRIDKTVPPAYKDAAKDDAGVGDLLIWKTILELGKQREKDVVFVTNETKADWWHRSEKQTLMPRVELIEEFRQYTDGLSFNMISFSNLFNLLGGGITVVEEIRAQEEQQQEHIGYMLRILQSRYEACAMIVESIASQWEIPIEGLQPSEIIKAFTPSMFTIFIDLDQLKNVMKYCEMTFSRKAKPDRYDWAKKTLEKYVLLLQKELVIGNDRRLLRVTEKLKVDTSDAESKSDFDEIDSE